MDIFLYITDSLWCTPETNHIVSQRYSNKLFFCFLLCLFVFSGPHLQHMEVSRLGVQSELQLLASTTATAIQDPSCVCDLHNSSQQCPILNPLSEARDQTQVLMDTRQVHNPQSHSRNSQYIRSVNQPSPLSHSRTFPSPREKTQYPLSTLPLTVTSSPGNKSSTLCIYGFAYSGISHKWNPTNM